MDIIDSVIAETNAENAQPDTQVDVTPQEAETPTQDAQAPEQEEQVTEEQNQPKEGDDAKPTDEPFPKKAVNAISRRDRKIGKQQGEIQRLQREMAELQKQQSQPAPKVEDFENKTHAEYLKAEAEHAADQRYNQREQQRREADLHKAESDYRAEVSKHVDEDYQVALQTFPDFDAVMDKHATKQLADGTKGLDLTPAALSALEESDKTAHALYAILNDNALDTLNSLSPMQAARMVYQYEVKADEMANNKRVSKAPEPFPSAKGRAAGGKQLKDKSHDEVHAWFNS